MNAFRLLTTARRELPRLVPLVRDPGIPAWSKIALVLAAILILSPLNVLGDLPLVGFLDDAALLAFAVHVFVRYAERRTYVA